MPVREDSDAAPVREDSREAVLLTCSRAFSPQVRRARRRTCPFGQPQPARPCCSSAIRFFATLLLKSEQQSMRMYVDHSSIAFCVSPFAS